MVDTTRATAAQPLEHRGAQVSTGVPGFDEMLLGGLAKNRIYLVTGLPGTGKTTLGLQFLMQGRNLGERCMYVTLSETVEELTTSAVGHGWSLDGLSLIEMLPEEGFDPEYDQTLLHPSEAELGETIRLVIEGLERERPARLVIDSLSELRLLAQSSLRFRRQILTLKHHLKSNQCTALLLDDQTVAPPDLQLHSIVHGVVEMQQNTVLYGPARRQIHITKMRGAQYHSGYHDFSICPGGIVVHPRLFVVPSQDGFSPLPVGTGLDGLDALLGGGLSRGTNTLVVGPAGVGKTSISVRCVLAALERGEPAAYFLFDEGLGTFLARCADVGMDLRPHMTTGRLLVHRIDPAGLSPGGFAHQVRSAVEQHDAQILVIDSLTAFVHSMPIERHVLPQMHEMLDYLNSKGVVTLLVLGQRGLVGEPLADTDIGYLSDGLVLMRFFEDRGMVRRAMSVVKTRSTHHEQTIREFNVGPEGLAIGEVLRDFDGVLNGSPVYHGKSADLMTSPDLPAAGLG